MPNGRASWGEHSHGSRRSSIRGAAGHVPYLSALVRSPWLTMDGHDRVSAASWLLFSAVALVAAGAGCSADDVTLISPPPIPDGSTGGGSSGGGTTSSTDASACHAGAVDTYQPEPYHFAAAAWRGVCVIGGPTGTGQDRGFFDACLGPQATRDACTAFRSNSDNDGCASCIETADTASHYGPLINQGGTFLTANVAGCIELTDPNALSCAKALQARNGCESWACEANCPVADQNSRSAYDACAADADRTGCQSYAAAAECALSEADSGPASKCLLSAFADFYYAVVPLFCGSFEGGPAPLVDGAVDAAASGGDDGAPSDASSADGSLADASVSDGSPSPDSSSSSPADAGSSDSSSAGPADASPGSLDAGRSPIAEGSSDVSSDAGEHRSADSTVGPSTDAAKD